MVNTRKSKFGPKYQSKESKRNFEKCWGLIFFKKINLGPHPGRHKRIGPEKNHFIQPIHCVKLQIHTLSPQRDIPGFPK